MIDNYKIYKMTHKPTGKIYIGMTKNDIRERFLQHMQRSIESHIINTKLEKFISNTNPWDFDMVILEEGYMNKSQASRLEAKYIEEYDSVNNGLNSSIKGANTKYSEHFKYSILSSYLSGKSINNISNDYNISKEIISYILRKGYNYAHVYPQLQPPPWNVIYPQLIPPPWNIVLVSVPWGIQL